MTDESSREVFKVSYDEVLSALKHQDDKLNRTLTAIAFLTAAGVAVFTNIDVDQPMTFGSVETPVTAVLFVLFLMFVALALISAVSAIGPSTSLKWRYRPPPTSLLFYAAIHEDDNWDSYLDLSPIDLQERLAKNLHSETKKLAARVSYKVARSREAGAFLQLVVVVLALLGIFSIEDLGNLARWWVGSFLIVLIEALPLWDLTQMKKFRFSERNTFNAAHGLLVIVLAWTVTLLAGAVIWRAQWVALAYGLAALLLTRLSLIHPDFAQRLLVGLVAAGGICFIFEVL